ncbi:anti-sigma factor [Spongiivirga sp. MCCC 1A20706]|uniref:anti-sigma factor domain-containing protein n=1 Tax=Spongiivirga sp. MCCC 1A20706 TaxID=3160963 RepID=UPI003977580B
MKETITTFLAGDALEKYILGTCTDAEAAQVEHYIDIYPEVKDQYDTLQDSIENFAKMHARKAPVELRDKIMADINTTKHAPKTYWTQIAVAASVIFAALSVFLYTKQNSLLEENNAISQEMRDLKLSIEQSNTRISSLQNELNMLNNPDTKKYVLNGNEKARKLQTVAYINSKERLSLINVLDLPDLPEEKCYQMWANVDGEMVSLGILEINDNKLQNMPYKENALSYNITIEPKGGNKKPTEENTVANIAF